MLSATKARYFRDEGYLMVRGLLDAPPVEAARKAAERDTWLHHPKKKPIDSIPLRG